MDLKFLLMLFPFVWISVSCGQSKNWTDLDYCPNFRCDSLSSFHSYDEGQYQSPITCQAFFDDDTLVLHLSDMGWQYVIVKIKDGKFNAELNGVPFDAIEYSFQTKSPRLQVGKSQYAANDTICGNFDFLFLMTDVSTGKTCDWSFKGSICEIIRQKDFNPFAEENFMTFDLPTAIHEMGEPPKQDDFDLATTFKGEFGIELFNYFQRNQKDITIKELTWDTSPTRDISDEGRERLTIWYIRKQDKIHLRQDGCYKLSDIWNNAAYGMNEWLPLHYLEWNADVQF